MTQNESAALMNDQAFKGRIKVCLVKFADAIMIEPSDTPGKNTRQAWARETLKYPENAAGTFTPAVVMDPAVQLAGSMIGDPELQAAVEATVNKSF